MSPFSCIFERNWLTIFTGNLLFDLGGRDRWLVLCCNFFSRLCLNVLDPPVDCVMFPLQCVVAQINFTLPIPTMVLPSDTVAILNSFVSNGYYIWHALGEKMVLQCVLVYCQIYINSSLRLVQKYPRILVGRRLSVLRSKQFWERVSWIKL